jgi:RNA polymerase sigma-70 factor (ECF subfamily)
MGQAQPIRAATHPLVLAEVLRRLEPYLTQLAQRRFPRDCQGRFGVSDVVQETMLKAHANADQFRGESEADFRSWLAAVLINTLRSMRERQQRLKRGGGREQSLERVAAVPPVDQPTPSAEASKAEQNQKLLAAIERLPEDYRRVVQLRNLSMLSFREIGERMGRSEDAAQHLWCRAIRQLRSLMA